MEFFRKKFFAGGVCESGNRLENKVVVITGGNTGIGKATAENLATRGARVIILCRDEGKGLAAVNELKTKTFNDNIEMIQLDLSCINSIKKGTEELRKKTTKINILILNAGIMACDELKTNDGFDMQMGVNHLGHFLFTSLVIDLLKVENSSDNCEKSRIVVLSSMAHTVSDNLKFEDKYYEDKTAIPKGKVTDFNFQHISYSRTLAYGRSKLANILFVRELARRVKKNNINAYAVHPGVVKTELTRYLPSSMKIPLSMMNPFTKTITEGAQTTIACAVDDSFENATGLYYADCLPKLPSEQAQNDNSARALWKWSEDQLSIKFQEV
ncbi:hypothetical protein SNEBB_005770 [Seison nebaliae]|nr:hypothetical protein SNEBB_005770 [Seison nebaliae]